MLESEEMENTVCLLFNLLEIYFDILEKGTFPWTSVQGEHSVVDCDYRIKEMM